jgi:hypothetical protein
MDWLLTPWISIGGAVLLAVIAVMAVVARRPPKARNRPPNAADPAAVWLHADHGRNDQPPRDIPGEDDGDGASDGDGDADGDGP